MLKFRRSVRGKDVISTNEFVLEIFAQVRLLEGFSVDTIVIDPITEHYKMCCDVGGELDEYYITLLLSDTLIDEEFKVIIKVDTKGYTKSVDLEFSLNEQLSKINSIINTFYKVCGGDCFV